MLLQQPLARATELQAGAVDQQVDGLRFCCKVWRWLQAACKMALVSSHHAAISNISAMKLAWARMSRPPMFRSCPFLIIAIAS